MEIVLKGLIIGMLIVEGICLVWLAWLVLSTRADLYRCRESCRDAQRLAHQVRREMIHVGWGGVRREP